MTTSTQTQELDAWDGWGMTPTESLAFSNACDKQAKKEAEARATASKWIATFKDVQGDVTVNKTLFNCDDEAKALRKAKAMFGQPDGYNTFVWVNPAC